MNIIVLSALTRQLNCIRGDPKAMMEIFTLREWRVVLLWISDFTWNNFSIILTDRVVKKSVTSYFYLSLCAFIRHLNIYQLENKQFTE